MIDKLGINLTSLIAQIVNLLILFFVLKKFIFQVVLDTIKNQKEKNRETEKKANFIEKEKEKIAKAKEKELAKAFKEGERIISQAKKEGEKIKKRITKEAKDEGERLIKNANLNVKNEEAKMREKMAKYSADLAVKIAAKLIRESLDEETHRDLIKKAFFDLKKIDYK